MSSTAASRPPLLDPLDPRQWPAEIPVLIVGGGPVGLTSALLLAQRGIEVLLVERRTFESRFPRAHLLNVRTMEIFHEMGVAPDIYAQAPADEKWRKVVWYTSVTGPTPLHGLKLGEVPAWGGGPDAGRYAEASPRRFTNLPQLRLDPLLWAHAAAACPGRIRGRQELVAVDRHEGGGVTATIHDRELDVTRQVRARYLIAADGGRISAELLGVTMDGAKAIHDVVSYHVSTDLSMWAEPDALLAHFIQPWGQGRHVGTMQALGPHRYGRTSPEWLVAVGRHPGETAERDEQELLRRAREMLGVPPDHPMTMHAVSHWQYEGVIARRFRVGSAFLAGDAAHRHPPTGGLGLNSGVQDAHNLAWKLAAVLQGRADDALLDSYERERRPITAYYTAHALENAGRHAPIGTALGLGPGVPDDEGWRRIAVFAADTPAGEKRRALVAEAVAANANDYSQLNVEAGYHYTAGALVPDGTPPPEGADSPIDYRPTTRPGHHLPHVWLHHLPSATPVSTLDLVGTGGFTLFTDPSAARRWQAAATRATDSGGPAVEVVVVPAEDGAWTAVRQIEDGGAVLVRPDRTVCWRTTTVPDDPSGALDGALKIILGGGSDSGDPAQPYLERIRLAADRLRKGQTVTAHPLQRLRDLDTCAVSDALDTLGLPGATTGISPLWPVREQVVGRARTVTAGPRQADRPADHIAAAAIDAAGDGDVLVIANGGRVDVSCFGGILTRAASRRGIAGVVIDGACRDIAESESLGFGVFGRAVVPVSARGRIVQLAMDEPVTFAGVLVRPDDLVLADRNGVVFIPAAHADAVLDLATRIVAREAGMAEAVQDGQPVTAVMHDSRFPTVEEATR